MTSKLIFLSSLELIISVVICTIVLFFTFKVVQRTIAHRYNIKDDNIAYGIFLSSILFSVGFIVSSSVSPVISTFRSLYPLEEPIWFLAFQLILYLIIFVIVSWLLALLTNLLGIWLFTVMTRSIKEMEEISQNNISVSIITGMIVIVLAIFVKEGVGHLLESLVPYPELEQLTR